MQKFIVSFLFFGGGLAMNTEKFREKNYYKQKITELVEKIENPAILEYLYIFIQGKVRRYISDEEDK